MAVVLDDPDLDHHQVRIHRGARSGTRFVIAIHAAGDGVSLGGCRMVPYDSIGHALSDALELSRTMTLKAAAVGLRHGGAKCVIAAPSHGPMEPEARRATMLDVGDAVEELGGRFMTGKDAGTNARDFETMSEVTRHVVGLPVEQGGSGDPSAITAAGVLAAIEAGCEHAFGSPELSGRRIGIVGIGGVGSALAGAVAARGAALTLSDIDPAKRELAAELAAYWSAPEDVLDADIDVLAPCALGGLIDAATAATLRCRVIAGAANNQLSHPSVAGLLRQRGIVWAPDFVANAGGLLSVACEVDGYSRHEAIERTKAIGATLRRVFQEADRASLTPLEVAESYALATA